MKIFQLICFNKKEKLLIINALQKRSCNKRGENKKMKIYENGLTRWKCYKNDEKMESFGQFIPLQDGFLADSQLL